MKRFGVVIAVSASLVFAGVAAAHVLKVSQAHNASKAGARAVCNTPVRGLDCTTSGVDLCKRVSVHRVRCHDYIRGTVTEAPDIGATFKCTWWDQWSILDGSGALQWSARVFDRTLACREIAPPPPAP